MKSSRPRKPRKVVDELAQVRCALGKGVIREEVWQDAHGRIVRYNLAFINHSLSAKDHGRVLGYDNQHGHHHRHFGGAVEEVTFSGYEKLLERFLKEVRTLRERKQPV